MKVSISVQSVSLLFGSLLLSFSSALGQTRERPDLQGSFTLEMVEPCKAIREKIETAIKGMPKKKDEARELLIDGNLPAPRLIDISYPLGEVTIRSLPSGPVTTPLDGSYVRARRDADDIEIKTKWKNCKPKWKDGKPEWKNCQLERTFRNKIGLRINAYSLRADGKLVMHVTAKARSRIKRFFGGSVEYELVYSRTAVDDQDIAYEKYPDCQEYYQRKGRIVIIDAGERATNILTDKLDNLKARKRAHASKGYQPEEVIEAVEISKKSLLDDLADRQGFSALWAMMDRTIIIPTKAKLADLPSGLVSEENLKSVRKETSAQINVAWVNADRVNIYVSSVPSGATFKIWTWNGETQSARTDGNVPPLFKGDYKYSLTKAGFKNEPPIKTSLDSTIQRLDCVLIKENDPEVPQPCNVKYKQ